ncbi:MAG: hypothetical protein H8E17_20585 [Deltaproteobacteria bacterium]|nr:hypothetical protein [Deltaproteobacteria bacterium]MBL6987077.1 hypothetical protein [Methylobacter sp.]
MYCIYSDKDVTDEETNSEHIFPLTLGGKDDFTLQVSKELNSLVNREIDEKLAHCSFLAVDRRQHNAQGHRKTEIQPSRTKSLGKRPVKFVFDTSGFLQPYNPRLKTIVSIDEILQHGLKVSIPFYPYLRLRFAAKVGLAAGYLVFGDGLRRSVIAHELRSLMHLYGERHNQEVIERLKSKVWAWPYLPPQEQKDIHALLETLSKHIKNSFVAFITCHQENQILIVVGIFGNLAGCIFCPTGLINIPKNNEYDLGHVIILAKHQTRRISVRELLMDISMQRPNK